MHASEWPANKPKISFQSTYTIATRSQHKYVYVYAKQKQPGAVKKGARPNTVESRVACGT